MSTQNNQDIYFDDCPVCQVMKKMGLEMQYYEDGNEYENGFNLFDPGFYATKIDEEQLEELKIAFNKANTLNY